MKSKKAIPAQVQPVVICSDDFFDTAISALHKVRRIAIKSLKEKNGFDANSAIVEINETVISSIAELSKLSGRGLVNITGIFNR